MNRSVLTILVFLASPNTVTAQANCSTITEPNKRLLCYDNLNGTIKSTPSGILDFDDFVTDISSLKGKTVKVNVKIKQVGNLTFAYRKDVFGPFVLIDVTGLDRDDRKKINTDCSSATGLCSATVTGTATHVYEQTGIKVVSVVWN